MKKITATKLLLYGVGLALLPTPSPAADTKPFILAQSCAACHGPEGVSPGAIPTISGMPAKEIRDALRGFKSGARSSTVMGRHAKAYSDEEIDALAQYYGKK